jgi:hypothetical protein
VIVSKGTLDIKNDSKNSGRFHNHITKNQIKLHLVRQKLKVPGGCEHILNKRGHLDSGLVPHYPLRELSESIQYLHPPATNKEYSQYVEDTVTQSKNLVHVLFFQSSESLHGDFGFSSLVKPLQKYS